jgi:hypothetical protein
MPHFDISPPQRASLAQTAQQYAASVCREMGLDMHTWYTPLVMQVASVLAEATQVGGCGCVQTCGWRGGKQVGSVRASAGSIGWHWQVGDGSLACSAPPVCPSVMVKLGSLRVLSPNLLCRHACVCYAGPAAEPQRGAAAATHHQE